MEMFCDYCDSPVSPYTLVCSNERCGYDFTGVDYFEEHRLTVKNKES